MKLYSNEIVFRGHPDKVCDQISDAILDECLAQDKHSRCGIEVAGGKGIVFVTGEITTAAKIDVEHIVRRVLRDVGYPSECAVINNIGMQSTDIALGTNDTVGGAGDNGMMFGYATSETPEMLPLAMVILQRFSMMYDLLRQRDHRFKPDGKAQITGRYDENFRLVEIDTVTICYQNEETDRARTDVVIQSIFEAICDDYEIEIGQFLINPTGRFEIGGFEGDAGLTGRKIVVDNYQSFANVGGGAFSGKDPTKVDRTGAYKAREIAKRMLMWKDLDWCEVQLSYAIGKAEPLAIYIDSNEGCLEAPSNLYAECTPARMIEDLGLLNCKFEELARFGSFTD